MFNIYEYDDFIYSHSIISFDLTNDHLTNYTTVELLPQIEYTLQKFDTATNTWKYIRAPIRPGENSNPLDKILTYEDARIRDYPKMQDYVDGIVKDNNEQIVVYKENCNKVKTMWPKDMEPITLQEYYRRKGIIIIK
tara:strand:- start:1 stop:411 length:411 start_codon:yes stop_codon:yes gene_type:complete